MEPKKLRKTKRSGPEALLQEAVILRLRSFEWLVKSTHGNEFQQGFPDLYCAHYKYGQRWVELKTENNYSFTGGQLEFFPKCKAAGVGIWIVTHIDQVPDILFKQPNWEKYLLLKLL